MMFFDTPVNRLDGILLRATKWVAGRMHDYFGITNFAIARFFLRVCRMVLIFSAFIIMPLAYAVVGLDFLALSIFGAGFLYILLLMIEVYQEEIALVEHDRAFTNNDTRDMIFFKSARILDQARQAGWFAFMVGCAFIVLYGVFCWGFAGSGKLEWSAMKYVMVVLGWGPVATQLLIAIHLYFLRSLTPPGAKGRLREWLAALKSAFARKPKFVSVPVGA